MVKHGLTRRVFLSGTALASASYTANGMSATKSEPGVHKGEIMRPEVLFLDVNETLLDLDELKKSVAQSLNGRSDLVALWFSSLLHHSLVSTAGDRYEDFGVIAVAALMMVAKNHGIQLTEDNAHQAVSKIRTLPAHPDVEPALIRLKAAGFRIFTLTNSSNSGVLAQMQYAGLTPYLEGLFSVEDIGIYKPHTHTYRWAARKVNAEPDNCMLVAAHGWDVAGALWAGMRAAFISRPGQTLYPLAPEPTLNLIDFGQLADVLIEMEIR